MKRSGDSLRSIALDSVGTGAGRRRPGWNRPMKRAQKNEGWLKLQLASADNFVHKHRDHRSDTEIIEVKNKNEYCFAIIER
jgi:hypothetical protein